VGDVVPAGTVGTPGTWGGLRPARAGDRVVVAFEGIGEVTLRL
jgi:2-keto-4-pentenoate hydratase